jgi:hypothetical protein
MWNCFDSRTKLCTEIEIEMKYLATYAEVKLCPEIYFILNLDIHIICVSIL